MKIKKDQEAIIKKNTKIKKDQEAITKKNTELFKTKILDHMTLMTIKEVQESKIRTPLRSGSCSRPYGSRAM